MSIQQNTLPLQSLAVRRSFLAFASDIKLAHSIFALPFAAAVIPMAKIAWPAPVQIFLLLVAMVSARSFAMGMNRYLDRHIDQANPRTQSRAIPGGRLSARAGLLWSAAFGVIFIGAAFALNPLAGLCSGPVLLILATYSKMKNISWLCHWYLGACLGLAPVAVCIALLGQVPAGAVLLAGAITFWTAGFDILYALQDAAFDRQRQLRSVPARFTPRTALWISRLSFGTAVVLFWLAGADFGLGWLYFAAVSLIGVILTVEHVMVRDAARTGSSPYLNAAFFQANGLIAVLYLAAVCFDGWVVP